MDMNLPSEKYKEYHDLSDYQKKCLVATNYFRVINGLKEIDVPLSDEKYHKYFDKKCYDVRKEIEAMPNFKNKPLNGLDDIKKNTKVNNENIKKLTEDKKEENVNRKRIVSDVVISANDFKKKTNTKANTKKTNDNNQDFQVTLF